MLGHASPEMLCSVYARFMRACARRKSIKPGARVGKHGAEGGTRTPTGCPTRPSNVRVCQFRHFGPRTVAKYTVRRAGRSRLALVVLALGAFDVDTREAAPDAALATLDRLLTDGAERTVG